MIKKININLRERLNEGGILLVPGAPNALTARIIQDVGFEAIYLTGAGIANSYLGVPDLGLLTLTELASHVAATRDVVDLPLIVDADTGFGNAINIQRTVKVLERSGANAIQLEDQIFPKRCGHFKDKRVTSGEAMVLKIKAAVDARMDEDFLIIARTDARAVLGFEEALERGAMYFEAGADVNFIEAPRSIEEIKAIPRRLEGPQLVNMVAGGSTPLMPLDELEEAGYAMVIYANAALQSAIRGMKSVLTYLHREGSLTGVFDQLETFGERQRLVGKDLFDAAEKLYAISGERRG
jgi:2-methylisocitrate lyase-like PEP mutase family enzyme